MAVEIPEAAVIVGSRDDAAAGAFAERLRNLAVDGGAGPFESSEHAGVTIWSLSGTTAMVGNAEFAYAVTDGALILATGAGLLFSDRTRRWGVGILIGLFGMLIIGAGACVAVLVVVLAAYSGG